MTSRLWLALAAMAALSAPALASPSLTNGNEAPALPAWVAFCKVEPGECRIDPLEPQVVRATPELLELLDGVNVYVNRTISPVTDLAHRGVLDVWEFPTDRMGDCEDFQLLKRRYLAEAGVPRRAMPMTVVLDERGEGHAVLTVRTDEGDLILDNKSYAVKRWDETGYAYVKREAETATGWAFLEDVPDRAMVAAASRP
jgi:predicted transglutaminase-like cysteine proteinase